MNNSKDFSDSNHTKMSNLRKTLLLSTAACCVLQFFVPSAKASGAYDGTNGTVNCTSGDFTVQNNVVTGSNNCSGAASIPTGVNEIGDSAFQHASNLTTVLMSPTVTSIGDFAFSQTSSLTSVAFSPNLLSIGNEAFSDSPSLSSISIPSSVISIGDYAFSGANSLLSVVIPASVTTIGKGAFRHAASLTSISVNSNNQNYSSMDNVLYNRTKTRLIQFPAGRIGSAFSVPPGVTVIGENAFTGTTNLSSVTIPTSVTSIESGAFSRASALTSIVIPQGVTAIENFTFSGASALTSVTIPSSVTHIGDGAFNEAVSLQSIKIPASVTSIGVGIFSDATSLQRVIFLGNAPTGAGNLQYGVSPQPAAQIRSNAAGFGSAGGTWRGLTVSIGVYVVSFDSAGGSMVDPAMFVIGETVREPNPPVKIDQIFAGWTPSGSDEVISFPYSPTSDVVLKAKWSSMAATLPTTDASAQPSLAEATARTIRAKLSYDVRSLAKLVGMKPIPKGTKIDFSVSKKSKNLCAKAGSRLKTFKSGKCVVTFVLQDTTRKNGKFPKPIKTTVTLIIK